MKKRIITLSLALFSVGIMNLFYAQEKADSKIINWYNGSGTGMNTEKAYKALKKKTTKTVIVAVIDSGIDIEHEDLKGQIWVNEDEIPNNGIDDDKNGYIDDIHGWNFLGGSDGQNQNYARLEKVRILASLSEKYKDKDASSVAKEDLAEYNLYKQVKKEVEAEMKESQNGLKTYQQIESMLPKIQSALEEKFGKGFTVEMLEKWQPTSGEEVQMKQVGMYIAQGLITPETVKEALDHFKASTEYQLNVNYNDRQMIGDDPDNFNDVHYGNSDVEGPDALHGTHVGGIIGAVRHNNLGGDGVATDIKLMSLRAVPDGDEADKDVALAIRYAVDNGASVINMSFGKAYSLHQKEVAAAIAYADSKGVLLVHAAGNDGEDVDVNPNFPTNMYSFQTKKADLYLTIGSSTKDAKALASDFSNYGKTKVDVFAPGSQIYNSVPQSEYKILQGTSMAAPMVTGAAAMLKSYFPNMTMLEIKNVLLETSKKYPKGMITKPGSTDMVAFDTLSETGGVIDIYAAVKKCMKMEKNK